MRSPDSFFRFLLIFIPLGCSLLALGQETYDWRDAPVFTSLEAAREARALGQPIYRLDLTKQKLRKFPSEIAAWSELREVILNRNKLTGIDDDLHQWEHLEVFAAESNALEKFPASVLQWKALQTLRLGDNLIDSIPLHIDKLPQLAHLSLWSNVISYYPASLGDARSLKSLDLQYNDMTAEEQEMLKSWLPEQVELTLSAPCRCDFEEP